MHGRRRRTFLAATCLFLTKLSSAQPSLVELRRRVTALSSCVSELTQQGGNAGWVIHSHLQNVFTHGELHLCPPARVGYIHIFKSAGTTIASTFHYLCDKRFGANSTFVKMGVQTNADRLHIKDYRYFSFVRKPDERLLSAIYEVHLRNKGIDGHELETMSPSNFVKSVLLRQLNDSLVNTHLFPQVTFLLESGKVVPSLVYLGRVENLSDELAAIVSEMFKDRTAGTEAKQYLLHHLKRSRPQASPDPVAHLKVTDMRHDTKALLMGTYITAYVCLGYAL
ncbi:hypothetical protein AB1Y20_005522 [Prymnesium parvum]|uniref:Sulfotransferase n=1 Tax=Prymnesium parvum TaxID=97485 RepID=A0AB34J6H2_PRYPA